MTRGTPESSADNEVDGHLNCDGCCDECGSGILDTWGNWSATGEAGLHVIAKQSILWVRGRRRGKKSD